VVGFGGVSLVSPARLSAARGRVGCSSGFQCYRYSQRSFANNRGSRYVPDELVVAPAKRVWSWNGPRTRGRFYDTDVANSERAPALLTWDRRQAGLQDRCRRFGRCEKADQSSGGLGLSGRRGERPREGNVGLKLRRNRADESNTRDVYQFADLLKANLRLAARDDCGYRLAGWRPAHLSTLSSHLVGD